MNEPHRRTTARILRLPLVLILCLFLFHPPSEAAETESDWAYIDTLEGVELYRSLREVEGKLPFRATAELRVPHEKIVMALTDVERKSRWAPKLKSASLHSQPSPNRFEFSEYYTTPWPFIDREFLLLGTVAYEADRILFTATNSRNRHLADPGHVLVDIEVLTFAIIPLAPDSSRVVLSFSGDLGGWIPEFAKTIIQRKWPVRFIQALQRHIDEGGPLETERYRSLRKRQLAPPSLSASASPATSGASS